MSACKSELSRGRNLDVVFQCFLSLYCTNSAEPGIEEVGKCNRETKMCSTKGLLCKHVIEQKRSSGYNLRNHWSACLFISPHFVDVPPPCYTLRHSGKGTEHWSMIRVVVNPSVRGKSQSVVYAATQNSVDQRHSDERTCPWSSQPVGRSISTRCMLNTIITIINIRGVLGSAWCFFGIYEIASKGVLLRKTWF